MFKLFQKWHNMINGYTTKVSWILRCITGDNYDAGYTAYRYYQKIQIELLLTFGSYGTQRFGEHSDIDVGFISNPSINDEEKIMLLTDLIIYFGRDNIDLVDLDRATPLLLYEVACNSNVLYENNSSYLRFKLKAGARYADTKHLRELRREYLNNAIYRLSKGL